MGATVGRYHLFRRRRPSGTFYYFGTSRTMRESSNPAVACENKRDAVAYLGDLLANEHEERKKKAALREATFGEFARDMFLEGSPHLKRWAAKGRVLKRSTIVQYRRHITNYLLPRFGACTLSDIKPNDVEDFLLEQSLSNSC